MEHQMKVHWFDRAIGYFMPQAGYRLALARWQFDHLRKNYDAARKDNLWSSWMVSNQTSELQDARYRPLMIARCRDLERNSDTANSIVKALQRNVIGTGMRLQARVRSPDGRKSDEEAITKIESYWEGFSNQGNCDVTGFFSFAEMQKLIVSRLFFDGEVFLIETYDDDENYPYKLQILEVDQLDMTRYDSEKNKVFSGIEVNEFNKPVAYWFRKTDPNGTSEMEPERISADRVIHLADRTRPSQIHGVPSLAKSLSRIRDIDSYMEAENVKSRLAACFGVVIKSESNVNMPRGMAHSSEGGFSDVEIAPGMVARLKPGEDVQIVAPNIPTYMADFTRINQRVAASGQGLSYEQVSRDYSQTNYSSARQGLLEDQKTFSILQDYIRQAFCCPVYHKVLEAGYLCGALDIPNFWQDRKRYKVHRWIPPGWSWIDPVKEVTAQKMGMALGITTLEEICASQGKDWYEVIEQQAREKVEVERLGLSIFKNLNETGVQNEDEDDPKEK